MQIEKCRNLASLGDDHCVLIRKSSHVRFASSPIVQQHLQHSSSSQIDYKSSSSLPAYIAGHLADRHRTFAHPLKQIGSRVYPPGPPSTVIQQPIL